ncbi:acyltransferase [Vibrio sp.]|uniref:acyltransferase n=1 Tax=Vibrio sp. TaxID=678 RepID=UPI003D12AB2E
MKQRVVFFDLMRCVAAVAVVAIHVLAPYRHELGQIPFDQWLTAVSVNSVTRWAVPVFILISGALLLSDDRPFDFGYYVKRRLGKVLVPFAAWSLFYAYLSGWSLDGFDASLAWQVLADAPQHETYYHLGFFYYFIPLYFLIPIFQYVRKHYDISALYAYVAMWLLTTLLYLLKFDGPWSHELWLYSGYLPLGYLLYQRVPLNRGTVSLSFLLGGLALLLTAWSVVSLSLLQGEYTVGRWLSYKTLNVVLAASMVFMLCRAFADRLSAKLHKLVSLISSHSLGIYLLHPIFLWPMKAFGWHQGHPGWVIPLWIVISGAGSLATSWLLSKSKLTRWLLP